MSHFRVSCLLARAMEKLAIVIGCNAAGTSTGVTFGGRRAAIGGPWGEVISEAGTEPGRLDAEVDLDTVTCARTVFPALRDRVSSATPLGPTKE